MSYYYEGQERTTDYRTDGRMSVSEMISLLSHLNSEAQRPWIESFAYRYDENGNRSDLVITTTNDRPHKTA